MFHTAILNVSNASCSCWSPQTHAPCTTSDAPIFFLAADTSSGTSYGPKYYKTWLPRGLPNITNVDILAHQKPENDAANDPEACSRLYDQTLHIIRKRVGEIETEQKAQKGGVKKPEE